MSSDVYLDFTNTAGMCTAERVGDLGVMSYFGHDLLDDLRRMRTRYPEVNGAWATELSRKIAEFTRAVETDKQMSSTEFSGYGYVGPHGIDWEDALCEESVLEFLLDYLGWSWDVRVE